MYLSEGQACAFEVYNPFIVAVILWLNCVSLLGSASVNIPLQTFAVICVYVKEFF